MKTFTIIYATLIILLTGCGAPEREAGSRMPDPSQDLNFTNLISTSYTTGTLTEILYSDDGIYFQSPDIRDILELNTVHVDIYDGKGSIESTLDSDTAYYYLAEKTVGEHLRKSGDFDMYGTEEMPVHFNSPKAEFLGPHAYRNIERNSISTSSTYIYYLHEENVKDSNVLSRQEATLLIRDEGNSYLPSGEYYKHEYRKNEWPTPTIKSKDPVIKRPWEKVKK